MPKGDDLGQNLPASNIILRGILQV